MRTFIALGNGRDKNLGKPLKSDTRFVVIYRAVDANQTEFHDYDFVTLSRKFAIGHAEHQVAVTDEPQVVLRLMTEAINLYETTNVGADELFFHPRDGKSVKGREIKRFEP